MSRRSTPERIFGARRAALRNGLTDHGMPLETAEAWCAAWEVEADRQGRERHSSAYWDGALEWIAEAADAKPAGLGKHLPR